MYYVIHIVKIRFVFKEAEDNSQRISVNKAMNNY